jgi:hypothetical protein
MNAQSLFFSYTLSLANSTQLTLLTLRDRLRPSLGNILSKLQEKRREKKQKKSKIGVSRVFIH